MTHLALRRAQRLYREDVELIRPAGKKPKSDAQLDAEAGLRPRGRLASRTAVTLGTTDLRPQRDKLAGRLLIESQPAGT